MSVISEYIKQTLGSCYLCRLYLEEMSRLTNEVQQHLNTGSDGTCSSKDNCVGVCLYYIFTSLLALIVMEVDSSNHQETFARKYPV